MKGAETKPAATPAKKETPFFSKDSEQGFFGSSGKQGSFFSSSKNASSVQAKLTVGKADDQYEKEADSVADRVVQRMNTEETVQRKPNNAGFNITPFVQTKCAACEKEEKENEQKENMQGELQRKPIFESNAEPSEEGNGVQMKCASCEQEQKVQKSESSKPSASSGSDLESKLSSEKGKGSPLPESTRSSMESSFGADFSGVRVHTGGSASQMNQELGARAFTHGNDIYFNEGQYDTSSKSGNSLLAHELTHTIQQGASNQKNEDGPVQRAPLTGANHIQRSFLDSVASGMGAVWDATGGQLVDAAGNVIEMGAEFFWDVLEKLSPEGAALVRKISQVGILEFLKDLLKSALSRIFDGLMNNAGMLGSFGPTFQQLLLKARTIIVALAKGDCKPLFEAMDQMKEILGALAGEAWSKITEFFAPAVEFLEGLWTSYGAPFIESVKQLAGDVWDGIKDMGQRIWDWFAPLRETLAKAWEWLKGKLGLNYDETGEEGLIQWVQRKASEAWDALKTEMEPVFGPIRTLINKVKEMIPLEAILNLRETINEWLDKAIAMGSAMEEDGIAQQNTQVSLRDQILPAVLQLIEKMRGRIIEAGAWVAEKIGNIGSSVNSFFDSLRANSILSPAAGLIDWLQKGVDSIVSWAQDTVQGIFAAIGDGLVYLSQFARPILDLLVKIIDVLGNLLGKLPDLLMGPVWWMLPECIKEPIKNFLIEQILCRIKLFQQLMAAGDIWAKLKSAAMFGLKQVFVDGNLIGAIWTFYRTVLEILNVPPKLVTGIIKKGAKMMKDIINAPFKFLQNFLAALKGGFSLFFDNIWTHLMNGLGKWITGQLQGTGIKIPEKFTFKEVFIFICSLLGITLDKILEKVEEVTGKKGLKTKLKRWIDKGVKALDWLVDLFENGPAGVADKLEQKLSDLWDMVLSGVASWIETTIIGKAIKWIAEKLDPTGIMAVITTIIDVFNVIQGLANQLRQILEIIDGFINDISSIVKGEIEKSAKAMENVLGGAVPVAITLLSYLLGLDGIGDQVKEVVEGIRAKVDEGLDWLAKQAKGLLETIKGFFSGDDDKDSLDAALEEIEEEGKEKGEDGELTRSDADKIAEGVKKDYPDAISSISVIDGGSTWDFSYVQKVKKKDNPIKEPKKPRPVLTKPTKVMTEQDGYAYANPVTHDAAAIGNANTIWIPGWEHATKLNKAKSIEKGKPDKNAGDWVKGHKITFRMGGDGAVESNLFIIDRTANAAMAGIEKSAEKGLKELLNMKPADSANTKYNKVIYYNVTYGMHPETEKIKNFASTIKVKWGYVNPDNPTDLEDGGAISTKSQPPPEKSDTVQYNLNYTGWYTFYKLTEKKLMLRFVENMMRLRGEGDAAEKKYASVDDIANRMATSELKMFNKDKLGDQIAILRTLVDNELNIIQED